MLSLSQVGGDGAEGVAEFHSPDPISANVGLRWSLGHVFRIWKVEGLELSSNVGTPSVHTRVGVSTDCGYRQAKPLRRRPGPSPLVGAEALEPFVSNHLLHFQSPLVHNPSLQLFVTDCVRV